jgi:hypothetical protein
VSAAFSNKVAPPGPGAAPKPARGYVTGDELGRAVKGRETEVLDALDIAWRMGRPHITCPYPPGISGVQRPD